MADVLIKTAQPAGTQIIERFVDQGDGTWARKVAASGSGGGGGPVTQSGTWTVYGPLPAAPITGQQATTTSAVALPANALQNGLIITALPANTGIVYVGPSGVTTATGYPLSAGQSISFAVANGNGIFIIGSNTTDKIAYAGN